MQKLLMGGLGALFSLTMLFAGWIFSAQVEAIKQVSEQVQLMDQKVDEHAERLAKLEALLDMQIAINRQLTALQRRDVK